MRRSAHVLFAGNAALLVGVGSLARSLGLCSISTFGELSLQTHLHNINSRNRKKEFLWSGLLAHFEWSSCNGKHRANNLSRNFHSRLGIRTMTFFPMDLKIRQPTSHLPTRQHWLFDAVERLHQIIFGLGLYLRVDGLTKSK